MNIRTFVSFTADFPKIWKQDGIQPGKELAEFIVRSLAKSFKISEGQDREGWAWDFIIYGKHVQINSILAFSDDHPREWAIHNYVKSNALLEIFLGKRIESETYNFIKSFVDSLHKILVSDKRFRHIRWYFEKDWDSDPDNTWSKSPY